jgi:hypothetical protein
MKNLIKIIVLYGLIGLSAGCKRSPNEDVKEFCYSIPVRTDKISELSMEDIACLYSIVPLKTPDEIIVGKIEKVFLSDSLLIVWDSKVDAVFTFDYQGNYKNSIGRKGHGPAEYVDLSDVYVDKHNDRIYLSDVATQRVLQYDMQGNFLKFDKINNYLYSVIPDKQGYWGINSGQNINYYDLIYVNNKAKIQSGFFPIESLKSAAIPLSEFSYNNDDMFFYAPYCNNIYKIEKDNLLPYIHVDFGNEAIPYTYLQPDKFLTAINHFHYSGHLQSVYIQNNKLFFSFSEYEGKNVVSTYFCYTPLDTINPTVIYNHTIKHAKELVVSPLPEILVLSDSILVFQIVPNILPDKLLDKLNQNLVYGSNITSDSNPILVLYKLKN